MHVSLTWMGGTRVTSELEGSTYRRFTLGYSNAMEASLFSYLHGLDISNLSRHILLLLLYNTRTRCAILDAN